MKKTVLLFFVLLSISCSDENKTDAELLERDRKELKESLDSYKISPYKFGKILVRSSVAKDTISNEFLSFKKDLNKIFNKVVKYNIDDKESLSVLDYISIYRHYKKMENFIMNTNEDVFPTLTDAFNVIYGDSISKKRPFFTGKAKESIQNIEHSVLSAIVILSKDLGKEISLYECTKTKPHLLPDSEIKTLLQYFRGFLFFEKGLYYLSEDEITRNIEWLNKNTKVALPYTKAMFKWGNLSDKQAHIGLHALNHLFRGFNRLMMDRTIDEERALEDFEVFLKDAKEIGLDNEVIWSIETFLYLKNEKKEKAIASLTKLKSSSLLSSTEHKNIEESIEYLKNRESNKVLNGIYDKYFLSKIATKYMFSILSKVDWKTLMEKQNVPYTKEIFKTIEKVQDLLNNFDTYTSTEQLKKTGENLKEAGKNLWEKAKDIVKE